MREVSILTITESPAGTEEIPGPDCVQLLVRKERGVGRLAFVADGRPRLLPVTYVMSGDRVVFCTDAGTTFAAAASEAAVAFEVDAVEGDHAEGWSVVVEGTMKLVQDPTLVLVLGSLGLQPFVAGHDAHWVVIDPHTITGRRVPRQWCAWIR